MTSAETQKARHERIEQGQNATAIDAVVRSFIEQKIADTAYRMVSAYRAGLESRAFFGFAAEMSALQGLLASLESAQTRGEISLEKEVADGEKAAKEHRPEQRGRSGYYE